MPQQWPTAEDELRRQFYDWELRGRGWMVWPEVVHLEPPFRPFFGHYLRERPIVDDGRRHTVLSRLAALVSGEGAKQSPSTDLAVIEAHEPGPRYLADDEELRRFELHVPRERVIRPDAMAACLASLRGTRYPVAFEMVGTREGIALQVLARASDAPLLASVFRNHFPDVGFVPGDRLVAWLKAHDEVAFGVAEFGLQREFMLPLQTYRALDPDPYLAFVAAMEDLEENELAAFQVLFESTAAPWPESVFRAVTTGDGHDFFTDFPELAKLGKQKVMQPLFAATVRIALAAETEEAMNARFMRMGTGLRQYELRGGNEFQYLQDEVEHDQRFDFLHRESHRSGMLLGLDELVGLVHLPSVSVQSKALLGRAGLRSRAIVQPETRGLYLGVNRHAGSETPVYLSLDRARRHVHIVGASGSGKSNLLLQLLLDDIRQGGGVALLDPHGDLVDDLLGRIPDERVKDVILLDPADTEFPVGFNVLAAHSDLEKTLLASDLVAIFRRLSTSWGDQMHAVLANAIQAFLESKRGGTLADLRKFLVDPAFRAEFLTTIPDEEIVYYWKKEFPLLHGRPQGPILTRLDSFLRPKLVRQMVTQREMKIDFRKVMDEGRIFLAKLAQGAIGEENAALLGSFLMAKFHQTAMSRQDLRAAERRPFLVAADECQHFVTPSMASILSSARKYAVGLVLAHQDLTQLQRRDGEVFAALTANAGTRIVFRVGDADARALAEGFANFTADDLRTLSTGEAICRFDRADRDFNLGVPLVEAIDTEEAEASRERIVANSRLAYGQPPSAREMSTAPDEASPDETPASDADDAPPTEEPSSPSPTPQAAPLRPARTPAREKVRPEDPQLGRGGPQHKYLQELVKRFGEAQGYRVTIEKPTANGGSVDVALERADGSIAVEISVTSTANYEACNIAKCLAAGYSRVVLLASERRRLDAIAKGVNATLGDAERDRVAFLLPEEFLTFLAQQTPPPTSEQDIAGYKVRVSYKKTSDEDAKARQRAVAEVVAKSVKKLDQ